MVEYEFMIIVATHQKIDINIFHIMSQYVSNFSLHKI